ncbi:MAG: HlyD family type I secretion periplasmic adaptor subunit [Rhodospirillaceae bacterium]|nr:HlyD family type I secretion periplasmic adaptor subunit [Rhodospirillales bacterium]
MPNDAAANVVRPAGLEAQLLSAARSVVLVEPSQVGRAILLGVCGFAVAALIWASIGTVDVVAVAQGKVIAGGRSKLIQPMAAGVVRAVHVRDGQAVKAGDLLVELDPTEAAAEYRQTHEALAGVSLDLARLTALLTDARHPEKVFRQPSDADPVMVEAQRRLMDSRAREIATQLSGAEADLMRRRAEAASVKGQLAKIDEMLPLARGRSEARRELAEKGYGSRMAWMDAQQQLLDQEQQQTVLIGRKFEIEAGIAAAESQLRRTSAEIERSLRDELAEAERKVESLTQEVTKAGQKLGLQTLRAPVGGVVTQAQTLAVVVPADSGLEVEAMVLNKDIGFLQPGQRAVVKVETFNFTRYGSLEGKLASVSRDAVEDKTMGLAYPIRVDLGRTSLMVDGRDGKVVGMAIVALGEHFFSPALTATAQLIYVVPEARGGAAAVKLLRALRRWAAQAGAEDLHINVTTGIHPDRIDRFLRRMGFKQTGGNYVLEGVRG